MANDSEGFNYLQLLDIVSVLHDIRGQQLSYSWNDGIAKDFFSKGEFFNSYSFNVSEDNTYTSKHTTFKLSHCSYTDSGVSFTEDCKLDVCFDTAWFLNSIDKHRNKICINNVLGAETMVRYTDNLDSLVLTDSHFVEDYLFQLMTQYDIMYFEDLLVMKEIRDLMKGHTFHMSFCLTYNTEEHLSTFLNKVQGFLNDQN